MPTIGSFANTSNVVSYTWGYTQIKQEWSDDWEFIPWLFPEVIYQSVADGVSEARIAYDFGLIKRQFQTVPQFWSPLDLQNKYVQIIAQQEGYSPQPVWTGIIQENNRLLNRPDIPSGSQEITAYGAEHILDRIFINTATVQPGTSEAPLDPIIVDRVPTFNDRGGRGSRLFGNAADLEADRPVGPVYYFSNDKNVWNALMVLRYLCNEVERRTKIPMRIAGQYKALEPIEDLWDFNGKTIWRSLNDLIPRERGIGFYVTVGDSYDSINARRTGIPDSAIIVNVFTITDRAIKHGSKTLPANANLAFFALPQNHLADDMPLRDNGNAIYDRLIIQPKEPMKIIASFSKRDKTLTEAWKDSLADKYKLTGETNADKADRARTTDAYRGVYTRLRLPDDWDGKCGSGTGGRTKTNAIPKANKDGTVSFTKKGAFWRGQKVFSRDLPFEQGKVYSVFPIENNNPDGAEPEFLPILCAANIGTTNNSKYCLVEKLDDGTGRYHSAAVRPLDRELGFEVDVNPRHYFARGKFTETNTKTPAALDYQDLIFTAMFEADERPKIVIEFTKPAKDEDGDEKPRAERVKVIEVEGAEFWYVHEKAVVEVDNDGNAFKIKAPKNQKLRDDKPKLDAVAAYAQAWHGIPRQPVDIPVKCVGLFCPLGTMLVEIRGWGVVEPIRTPVSGRRIDFINQTTVLQTAYTQFDVNAVVSNFESKNTVFSIKPRRGLARGSRK